MYCTVHRGHCWQTDLHEVSQTKLVFKDWVCDINHDTVTCSLTQSGNLSRENFGNNKPPQLVFSLVEILLSSSLDSNSRCGHSRLSFFIRPHLQLKTYKQQTVRALERDFFQVVASHRGRGLCEKVQIEVYLARSKWENFFSFKILPHLSVII